MGMESEHETVLQIGRPCFDPPDDGVAVLDRKRKLSGHIGPAHALILRCWHPPAVNEALGPTADRSEQSAYRNLAILARGDFLLAQLRVAELDVPERRRLHRFFLCDFRTGSYMLKALQNLLIARMSEAISGFPLATRMSLRSCGLRPLFHVRTLPLRRACCARRTAGLAPGTFLLACRLNDCGLSRARGRCPLPRRLRRNRSPTHYIVRGDAAVVRDRVLERHHRIPDHVFGARSGRSRHPDCGSRAGCRADHRLDRHSAL